MPEGVAVWRCGGVAVWRCGHILPQETASEMPGTRSQASKRPRFLSAASSRPHHLGNGLTHARRARRAPRSEQARRPPCRQEFLPRGMGQPENRVVPPGETRRAAAFSAKPADPSAPGRERTTGWPCGQPSGAPLQVLDRVLGAAECGVGPGRDRARLLARQQRHAPLPAVAKEARSPGAGVKSRLASVMQVPTLTRQLPRPGAGACRRPGRPGRGCARR